MGFGSPSVNYVFYVIGEKSRITFIDQVSSVVGLIASRNN